MDKSFRYDSINGNFLIARHQVGDFGLHLGLIRSFSYGANIPPELPFFPGEPLPYHYFFDFLIGGIEKIGVRIDYALNGISSLGFSALLYLLYKFPQMLFNKKNKLLGIFSVLLFLFPSSFTFINFLKNKNIFSVKLLTDIWKLPNYIHIGPFDGSIISIFFTLNVFLNQRHLILGLVVSLSILYFVLSKLLKNTNISPRILVFLGIILGLSSRIHALIFLATAIVVFLLFITFKKHRYTLWFFSPLTIIFLSQLPNIINNKLTHPYIHLGFLSQEPFGLATFIMFWGLNLGIASFLIPLSIISVLPKQRKVFFIFLILFVLGNTVQFSYRIDHNHSIFNLFILFANFYIAYFLVNLWHKNLLKKTVAVVLLFLLTFSGFLNLMPIKNDFHFPLLVEPKNKFMEWIITNTDKKDIFLAKGELLDPIVLSGRRNYFGNTYYLSVMGYDFNKRAENTKTFFEATSSSELRIAKEEGIRYMVVPLRNIPDFNYRINKDFLEKTLKNVYFDKNIMVFQL